MAAEQLDIGSDINKDLVRIAGEVSRKVAAQREEILTAFVAKYGFDPDQVTQVVRGCEWFVAYLPPDEMLRVRRNLILDRARRRKFSAWQRFCLWIAGL